MTRILVRAGVGPFEATNSSTPFRLGYGNAGNLLFAHAVFRALYRPGRQLDADCYDPTSLNAEELNEKYDAFVLPLANAFRPQFETQLSRYTALIRRLNIPCIVVGVGIQAGLDRAELRGASIDASVRGFVSAVLDRSTTMGVRGEITQDYLKRLGFGAVDIIGCPSMFVGGPGPRIDKPNRPLDLADAVGLNHARGLPDPVGAFVRRALAAYPSATFVAQDGGEYGAWQAAGYGDRVQRFADAPSWRAFMKTLVFAAGARIHGNIAAVSSGVPAVVIVHDSRTLELAAYHEIPHVLPWAIETITSLADLYDAAHFEPLNAAAVDRFDRYRAFLERNGLDHALDDPIAGAEFDRLASAADGPAGGKLHTK